MPPLSEQVRKMMEEQERLAKLTNPARELTASLERIGGVSSLGLEASKLSRLTSLRLQEQAKAIGSSRHLAGLSANEMNRLHGAIGAFDGFRRNPLYTDAARHLTEFKPNALYRGLHSDELRRLAASFRTNPLLADDLASFAVSNRLLRQMGEMNQPWINKDNPTRSIAGFAEMQNVGATLLSRPAYEDVVSDAVRHALGDWRGVRIPSIEKFVDPVFSNDFYAQHGIQTELTDFSTPAFEEGMELAGFRPLTDVDLNKPVDALEISFERNNKAHDRLQRIEYHMRRFIEGVLTKAHEGKWVKRGVPKTLSERWKDKHAEDVNAGRKPRASLIDYAEFSDLWQIMEPGSNWPLFAGNFPNKEDAQISFRRLHIIRIQVAHSVLLNNTHALMLQVEGTLVMGAIWPDEDHDWLK
jgi:hypothetical protein